MSEFPRLRSAQKQKNILSNLKLWQRPIIFEILTVLDITHLLNKVIVKLLQQIELNLIVHDILYSAKSVKFMRSSKPNFNFF